MKKIFLIFLLLTVMITAVSCSSDKAAILFNRAPVTQDTAMNNSTVFSVGERIYYLIIMPKEVYSRYINIQIIKKDNEYERLGYKLYWGNMFRLKDEQRYYYDDYVVINEKGAYIMRVYSKDDPQTILTQAQFFVR